MKAGGTPPDARGLDGEIDRLYQLPLAEFTAARNELAKQSGKRGAEIKALAKPPVAAWAVNQLYWHRRREYDALVDAAQQLRRAHAAVLGGKTADVRGAGKAHEERVTAALDSVLEILNEAGHPVGDTMRQPILITLRALPAADPPGRLTRTLQPGGFEALAGLSIRGHGPVPSPRPTQVPGHRPTQTNTVPAQTPAARAPAHGKMSARDTKALAKARDAVTAATRAMKQAEHAAQREEFERARTARESDHATKALAKAREALDEAEAAVRDAETAEAAARRKKESAERRAQQSEDAVDASRSRLETAQKEFDAIKG